MGQSHSELKSSLDKLPSLRNKPELLKAELSQFVDVCPADQPLPVKLDKKVFDILHDLFTAEVAATDPSPFDLMTILQALQRFMKVRLFYQSLPKADLHPYVNVIKKADPMSARHSSAQLRHSLRVQRVEVLMSGVRLRCAVWCVCAAHWWRR